MRHPASILSPLHGWKNPVLHFASGSDHSLLQVFHCQQGSIIAAAGIDGAGYYAGEGIPQLVRAMADALDRLSLPQDKADDASGGTANDSSASENESDAPARQTAAPRTEDH